MTKWRYLRQYIYNEQWTLEKFKTLDHVVRVVRIFISHVSICVNIDLYILSLRELR